MSEEQSSNLPDDILAQIFNHLQTKADICRFRSICKPWRSFAISTQPHFLFPLSLPPLYPNSHPLYIHQTLIYLIQNPANNRAWVIKVTETGENKWTLLNPLGRSNNNKRIFSSGYFPNRINLLGFRYFDLGRSYMVKFVINGNIFDMVDFPYLCPLKKVAFSDFEGIFVLGLCQNDQIVMWKKGSEKWENVETERMSFFDDVVCYNGKFYVVDGLGRLVVIDPLCLNNVLEVVSPVVVCNFEKNAYLVISDYRLYMVIKVYVKPVRYYDSVEEEYVLDKSNVLKTLKINVFVFNGREKRWERVESIGNKVFFVSCAGSFSVSAEDLGWSKGNCVYFEVWSGYDGKDDMSFGLHAGVYNLENHDIATFSSLTDPHASIFCPASSWFTQA